ncbi:hypothetical protein TruAng_000376 [Truncatella angustata]|nr:hypothetical protein TruAng_000376 [Truncatella angustata]
MVHLRSWSPVLLVSIVTRTFLLAAFSQAAETQCYAPNGTATDWSSVGDDLRIYACPPGDDGFATCCVGGDFCHPDNLCYNLHDGYPVVHRQYCTDPTWKSSNCSPLCRDDQDVRAPSDAAQVQVKFRRRQPQGREKDLAPAQ